jgi:hypothetical protein
MAHATCAAENFRLDRLLAALDGRRAVKDPYALLLLLLLLLLLAITGTADARNAWPGCHAGVRPPRRVDASRPAVR